MVLHSVVVLTTQLSCSLGYLGAWIAKSITERHCEPTSVFLDKENGFTKGLDDNKKLLFEAYVDAMPLKWNVHFFPQR